MLQCLYNLRFEMIGDKVVPIFLALLNFLLHVFADVTLIIHRLNADVRLILQLPFDVFIAPARDKKMFI